MGKWEFGAMLGVFLILSVEGVSKLKFVGLDAKGTLSLEVEVHGGT